MKFPVLIVNLKNYRGASGDKAEVFFKYAEGLKATGNIFIAPPILDTLNYVDRYPDILIAQSVDTVDYGSSTGHIPLKRLLDSGVRRALVNHSEHKIPQKKIMEIVEEADKNGFDIIVCVDSIEELKTLLDIDVIPSAYAIEPPELIGTGRSVSKYKPQIIVEAVEISEEHDVPMLCGAGVSNGDDVKAAVDLGASGVLVASAIVKAANPNILMASMLQSMI